MMKKINDTHVVFSVLSHVTTGSFSRGVLLKVQCQSGCDKAMTAGTFFFFWQHSSWYILFDWDATRAMH